MKTLFLVFLLNFPAFKSNNFSLKVTIKGFENNNGKVLVALLEANGKRLKGVEEKIVNKQASVSFSGLAGGKYAVRVFQDENSNGKLDTGLMGIPKEKWGISNNKKPMFSGPKMEDMIFEINADKSIVIDLE